MSAGAQVTPAGVPRQASWGSRAGAFLIDVVILAAVSGVVLFAAVFALLGLVGDPTVTFGTDEALGFAVFFGAYVLVVAGAFLYAPLLMMRKGARNGQTLGKQAVAIRVVHATDPQLGFARSAFREVLVKGILLGFAGTLTAGAAVLLDFLWPLWDSEGRALHDMLAATRVVRAERSGE